MNDESGTPVCAACGAKDPTHYTTAGGWLCTECAGPAPADESDNPSGFVGNYGVERRQA